MTVVYISIGNSDDKLSQRDWSAFVTAVGVAVARVSALPGAVVHGAWLSHPDRPWQNACWCLQLPTADAHVELLRHRLAQLAKKFRQDSIAWAPVTETEFIRPLGGTP
ncbi:hypothetical protein [Actinoplanes sp. URMC 104]|uniref:hypothetical protein n=1 Tax=Actinoplanes sp. URMC 104 TaxID=3423409 RepID=UPI003F19DFDA